MNETSALRGRGNRQRRAASAALITGGVIFFLAEFIAAAAWTKPPYSYTYHYISNLGVHGPSEGFGQLMYSPLAWVMNTGFFLFGITLCTGAAMVTGLQGGRRWAVLIPGFLLAVGGVLLGFFPGTGEVNDSGAVDFHSIGALAGIIGGNVLIIVLGRLDRYAGIPQKTGKAMVILGVFGLISFVGFMSVAGSSAGVIGLIERCAVYPVLIGLILAGKSIWNPKTPDTGEAPSISLAATTSTATADR